MPDTSPDVFDGVVPSTPTLNDKRRGRIKSKGRPPSQYFLKENILITANEEGPGEHQMEENKKVAGDVGNEDKDDETEEKKLKLQNRGSFDFKHITAEEPKETLKPPPPWLEELRKKRQQNKLHKNLIEPGYADENGVQEHDPYSKISPSTTYPEDHTDDIPWISQVRKKKHYSDEESLKLSTHRSSINTILVVNNSGKNHPTSPPISNSKSPIPGSPGHVTARSPTFPNETRDKRITEEDNGNLFEETTAVMGTTDFEKISSFRETDNESPVSWSSLNSKVFVETSSTTLVRPLVRSESLNGHGQQTNSTGNTTERKGRILTLLERLEGAVIKSQEDGESIKKEVDAIIESNRRMMEAMQAIKSELDHLQ